MKLNADGRRTAVLDASGTKDSYDAAGNRTSRFDSGLPSNQRTLTYAQDANDRLTKISGANSYQIVYTYDDNGSTLNAVGTGGTDSAAYDWRRPRKDDRCRGHAGLRRSLADGFVLVRRRPKAERDRRRLDDVNQAYDQVLEEYAPGGVLAATYVQGLDLIFQDRGGIRSFVAKDGLGSTRALTDASGGVLDTFSYDAFGTLLGHAVVPGTEFLFAVGETDTRREFGTAAALMPTGPESVNISTAEASTPAADTGGRSSQRNNEAFMFKLLTGFSITVLACSSVLAQPPTRKFDAPGAPPFKVLKEGENPPLDAYDNFVIGPNYVTAPERAKVEGVPEGKVKLFEFDSKETKLFNPGIARKQFGKVDPNNPKTLIVETHTIDYKRRVGVYVPAQYKEGTEAPFMVVHDGPGQAAGFKTILDNLIHQKRIPPIVLISLGNGGGDAQGHERGKEYDNMNGDYAEYIETEVLPRVEMNCGVKLTKNPDGRAAMGNSSGGSAALIMAWFRNDLYHRVLTTSGTFVNQAWPFDPKYPDGAWGFHETLIPNSPKKPIRLFISVGDADLLNPNVMRDGMHDWVEANHRMAKVLKAKGYEYQYLFCRGARHSVGNAQQQFLPHAIEWVWKGYAPKTQK